MFKHTISELKEALVCLQAGQVTLPYPYQPHPAAGAYRGKPVLDMMRCVGCGACANVCPPRLISLEDAGEYRSIRFELGRCTYCGSCQEACPAQAVTLSPQFELATGSTDDLTIHLKLNLVKCRSCGAVVGTRRAVNRVQAALVELTGEEVAWLDLCLACKRKAAMHTPELALEVNP